MKHLVIAWLSLVYTALAQSSVQFEKIVRYREVVSGQTIEVAIHQKPFDYSGCKLTGGENTGEVAKLDGVEVAGTDGRSPSRITGWPVVQSIAEIELKWNGKAIPVPKRVHINLFHLTLSDDRIQFIPRPAGDELLIQATGGDGGASYLVSLVLRKDGKHQQYECGYCESGLRPFPYEIEEPVGVDEQGRTIIKTFTWLEPKEEQDDGGQPATRPESK
jgi:hypothetical protein